MERSENIPIGDYTKAVLVKELQECNIINTRLETELNKRKILAQKNEFKCDNKSFSTEKLTEIVEEDKTVLKELAVQYKQLYELNGCDTKLCSNDDGLADGAAQAKPPDCDCKKVEEIKDALLKLLNDNYELCGILKENIKILHVKVKYYPDQEVIPNGRDVVPPNIISELVNDICEEMDQILKICKTLWDVADRFSGHLRDSGIETGITESFDSLMIKSNASSGDFWVDPSNRSASEHTDDQTDLKSLY